MPIRNRQDSVKLFMAGDVMTGRGIDQVLPHPGDPQIFESCCHSAQDYVQLAGRASGPIPRQVDFAYIWGDALEVLDASGPDVRIVNLETAVTRSGSPWPHKGIQYRMHPANVPCLTAAGIDCCVLANNHVLDWGYAGFGETLASLAQAGLSTAGAGSDLAAAQAPAILDLPGRGRVLVFAAGLQSSGIPASWAARQDGPGIHLLSDLTDRAVRSLARSVHRHRQSGDTVVVSLHWGGNWGYAVPDEHTRFARALIDNAGVDLVHGHSAHHPLGIEVYRGRPILYGCGDLIDDYEGIGGYEQYRTELALLYLVTLGRPGGELLALEMVPLRRRRFRLVRATPDDVDWLGGRLDRECRTHGARVARSDRNTLLLGW